jgi:hypothetical protein
VRGGGGGKTEDDLRGCTTQRNFRCDSASVAGSDRRDEGWADLDAAVFDDLSHMSIRDAGVNEVVIGDVHHGWLPYVLLWSPMTSQPFAWSLALRPTRLAARQALSVFLTGLVALRRAVVEEVPPINGEEAPSDEVRRVTALIAYHACAEVAVEEWSAHVRELAAERRRAADTSTGSAH